NFGDLYTDYESIRDHHSLETVKKYADLAIAANAAEKEDNCFGRKGSQIMGEHLQRHSRNSPSCQTPSASFCFLLCHLIQAKLLQACEILCLTLRP
ncbi:hypothetical protein CEXT_727731, partial [Caerostris extrusa]